MGIRVTQQLLVGQVLSNLNQGSRRILDLENELATGLRVNRPSDDPLAARRAVDAKSEKQKNEQFLKNITAVRPQLSTTETAIQTSTNVLQRVKELTLQGVNGTNGQPQRDSIASEINQLLEEMVNQGNSTSNGRYVFGGTNTLNAPMTVTRNANGEITAVNYAGNSGEIPVQITDGSTVVSNVAGNSVFFSTSAQTVDLYQTFINIRDGLRSNNTAQVNTGLSQLDTGLQQFSVALSKVGAVQNRLDQTESNLDSINTQLAKVVSDNVDADFADVTLNLNAQTNAYQAALNAGARVIQPSLLDYIR